MKIVTLVENTAPEALEGEHGLSLYLETGGQRILFDAGQSEAFARNAGRLGVDLAQVDHAILSHGHYDHGGGMAAFRQLNPTAPLWASSWAFSPHRNAGGKDIGAAPQPPGPVAWVEGQRQIAPGLTLVTLPMPPEDAGGMTALVEGQWRQEDFRHEIYLLVQEGQKRILISGCSHKGIRRIAAHFRPQILVGGFHLMKLRDPGKVEEIARQLKALGITYYTGHCTGAEQFARLKPILGDQLHSFQTGDVWWM